MKTSEQLNAIRKMTDVDSVVQRNDGSIQVRTKPLSVRHKNLRYKLGSYTLVLGEELDIRADKLSEKECGQRFDHPYVWHDSDRFDNVDRLCLCGYVGGRNISSIAHDLLSKKDYVLLTATILTLLTTYQGTAEERYELFPKEAVNEREED